MIGKRLFNKVGSDLGSIMKSGKLTDPRFLRGLGVASLGLMGAGAAFHMFSKAKSRQERRKSNLRRPMQGM